MFLVFIALIGQTLRAWSADSDTLLIQFVFARITDNQIPFQQADLNTTSVVDLAMPASTDVKNIKRQFDRINPVQRKQDSRFLNLSFYDVIVVQKKPASNTMTN